MKAGINRHRPDFITPHSAPFRLVVLTPFPEVPTFCVLQTSKLHDKIVIQTESIGSWHIRRAFNCLCLWHRWQLVSVYCAGGPRWASFRLWNASWSRQPGMPIIAQLRCDRRAPWNISAFMRHSRFSETFLWNLNDARVMKKAIQSVHFLDF